MELKQPGLVQYFQNFNFFDNFKWYFLFKFIFDSSELRATKCGSFSLPDGGQWRENNGLRQ